MTVAYADSLLGRTWDLRVGHRNGAYMVDPPDWHPRCDLLVDNVEGLCRKILNAANDRLPERLEWADYDESLGYLLGRAVELVPRYRPRDQRSQLGAWLKQELHWDLLDYWERVHGRKGEKRVVDLRPALAAAGVADGDPGLDRPDQPAARSAGDADADRALPREWSDLPADRGTLVADTVGGLGLDAGGGGQGGVGRAGVVAGGRAGAEVAGADPRAAWLDCLSCSWRHYPSAPNGVPGWHYPDACTSCGRTLR